jgi:tRNA(Arg) A34 adenosine deaminase TadA
MNESDLPALPHETLLRRSFEVARKARSRGEHPFGCILVDATGVVLMEQGNGYHSEGGDMTAHAERLIASRASKQFSPAELSSCTLYSSAEPCAMCAGALYWAGIGRVVYDKARRPSKPQPAITRKIRRLICPAESCSRQGSAGLK